MMRLLLACGAALTIGCASMRPSITFVPDQPTVTVEAPQKITSADGQFEAWIDDRGRVRLLHLRNAHIYLWPDARAVSLTLTADGLEWRTASGRRTCWRGPGVGGARPCDRARGDQ